MQIVQLWVTIRGISSILQLKKSDHDLSISLLPLSLMNPQKYLFELLYRNTMTLLGATYNSHHVWPCTYHYQQAVQRLKASPVWKTGPNVVDWMALNTKGNLRRLSPWARKSFVWQPPAHWQPPTNKYRLFLSFQTMMSVQRCGLASLPFIMEVPTLKIR